MWKICIFTSVIAVVVATTLPATPTPATSAAAATTTLAGKTITNDLGHAPEATEATSTHPPAENRTLLKISRETVEFSTVGGSTSTATPTTTATTSTTTTQATTITAGVVAAVLPENEETRKAKLMTTAQKMPLAGLGELSGIKDALHRIKLSEKPVEATAAATTITTEQPEAEDQDEADEADMAPTISPLQIQMQAAASYQVAETLADLNEEERARYDAMLAQQPTASKLNIVDLYPLKIDDFQPIIQSDNEELIKQRTVFTQPENTEEYKQNLMPNEVELIINREGDRENPEKIKINIAKVEESTPTTTTGNSNQGTTADFTGKLLADQDDLITEIESKFQLHETTTLRPKVALKLRPGDTLIDRRVKKSFEFPMQHRASDVMAMPHIDFANTKFQTDADAPNPPASHPEFSTTKFYNSKELYNEMLLHNKRKLMKETKDAKDADSRPIKSAEDTTQAANLNVTPEGKTFSPTATATTTGTGTGTAGTTTLKSPTTTASVESTTRTTDSPATTTTTATAGKYQKELKRAKLLLKALTPPKSDKLAVVSAKVKAAKLGEEPTAGESPSLTATSTSTSSTSPSPLPSTTTMATPMPLLATARTRPQSANPTKTASKPIARPRILSRLQEKINSLECEIPTVPQDSHLWRGNETHELLLPIVVSALGKIYKNNK